MLSAQNSQSLTIILISLLGKSKKMAFKLDVEPLPELQYKTLNQSFFLQLPPTPQAPTTIKIGHCKLSWVNDFQIQICLRIFSSSSFRYLSVSRLIFPKFMFLENMCCNPSASNSLHKSCVSDLLRSVQTFVITLHELVTHGVCSSAPWPYQRDTFPFPWGNSHFWSPSPENLCRKQELQKIISVLGRHVHWEAHTSSAPVIFTSASR